MFLARKYTAPQIANYFKISYRQVYQHLETFKASGGHFVKA